MTHSAGVAALLERFAALRSTDTRVVATGVVVVAAVVGLWYVVPQVIAGLRRAAGRAVVRGPVREWRDRVRSYTPWWISERLVVSLVQFVGAVVAVALLLSIWGQLALVIDVVTAVSLSAPIVGSVGVTVGLLLVAWLGVDLLDAWLDRLTERSEGFSRHQEEIAFRVLQLTVFGSVALAILTVWGVDLGGLLVGAGFLGIVVGMAARQTLGSLLAGFVLMFSRPFEIGDWVEIGQQEGIVTDITIVNTRLENFDGEFVVLPNTMVTNSTIVNRSKKGRLRIAVEVGVDYETDPEHAESVAVDAIADAEGILTVPRPVAITRRLADSAIVIELRFWIDKPSARRRARATSRAIRAVKAAFDSEGIKIPFPQREIAARPEAGGFRVADQDAAGGD